MQIPAESAHAPWCSGSGTRRANLKDRHRQARQDLVLIRVATVVLIVVAIVFMVIMFLIIATQS